MTGRIRIVLSLVAVVGLLVSAGTALGAGPQVMFGADQIDLATETKIVIKGTGFQPEQALEVLYIDPDGVQTDIGYALEPAPKADGQGNFETTWDASRYISKKLLKAGDYEVLVTDADYNPLAKSTLKCVGKPAKKKD